MMSFAAISFVFSVDPSVVIQLLLSIFMPIAVGFVTTRITSGAAKAWLLAGLTLISALLTQLLAAVTAGVPFDVGIAVLSVIGQFVISVAIYYGLWKPTGIAAAAQDVDSTTIVK
jgi:hypothetical protein